MHQQHPKLKDETCKKTSAWIIALATAMKNKIGKKATDTLFSNADKKRLPHGDHTKIICNKLDGFTEILGLTSYNDKGYIRKNEFPT